MAEVKKVAENSLNEDSDKTVLVKIFQIVRDNALVLIFLLSFFSTISSLYYSEIEQIAPCPLCWWQRIFIYGIAIVSAMGIIIKDKNAFKYILAFAIPGFLFALYHTLLQTTQIFGTSTSCGVGGISCAKIDIAWNILGINIPMPGLALIALSVIIVLSLINIFKKK